MNKLAKVITDSTYERGTRLTTIEVRIPRCLQAELNTHRNASKNSASSRAIPTKKFVDFVLNDPYIPTMGQAGRGMQDHGELSEESLEEARNVWLAARDKMVEAATKLRELGVHKQTQNRLLEPWLWQTVIVTSTDWANFLNLRCHKDTQPDFQRTAHAVGEALRDSTPRFLGVGEWHLPYLQADEGDLDLETRKKVSVARCARVSYLTHDGVRSIDKDLSLYDRLVSQGHMSPTEHVACPLLNRRCGNFVGWYQHRKEIAGEENHYGFSDENGVLTPAAMYGVYR